MASRSRDSFITQASTKLLKPETTTQEGFYSEAARQAGGRPAAIKALVQLERDLEVLLADLDERIPSVEQTLQEQEAGSFAVVRLNRLDKATVLNRNLELSLYLRKLRAACKANLVACAARRKELRI